MRTTRLSYGAGSLGNTIRVWAVTHTSSIRTAVRISACSTDLTSEIYGQPVPQQQKNGKHPLGQSVGEPVPEVEANDARMNQVVFAAGRLWSGVNTIVNPGPRDGIAWFSIAPSVSSRAVSADIRAGLPGGRGLPFLSFPSIGVNDSGRGVVAYSAMGRTCSRPRAGPASTGGIGGAVRLASRASGRRTASPANAVRRGDEAECRWGDYSASFALPNGEVWSATEFIGDNARTQGANWSTFAWPVRPRTDELAPGGRCSPAPPQAASRASTAGARSLRRQRPRASRTSGQKPRARVALDGGERLVERPAAAVGAARGVVSGPGFEQRRVRRRRSCRCRG